MYSLSDINSVIMKPLYNSKYAIVITVKGSQNLNLATRISVYTGFEFVQDILKRLIKTDWALKISQFLFRLLPRETTSSGDIFTTSADSL